MNVIDFEIQVEKYSIRSTGYVRACGLGRVEVKPGCVYAVSWPKSRVLKVIECWKSGG